MDAQQTEFFDSYLVAMLWSTTDESTPDGGEPMDANYSADDIAPEALERCKADCPAFLSTTLADGTTIQSALEGLEQSTQWTTWELAGHDFWLTRCGHGAGFWDRPEVYGQGLADALTELSHQAGERWPYVGDDGLIYVD